MDFGSDFKSVEDAVARMPWDRSSYDVGPTFVRVAGLPVDVLDRLRFPKTAELVDESLDLEVWLSEHGEAISEALYEAIGKEGRSKVRRSLVELRRAAHNGRAPKGEQIDEELLAALPERLSATILSWCRGLERRVALASEAAAMLETEYREKRQELRRIVGDRAFQQGVVLASRDLYPELVKWLDESTGERENRKLEIKLFKYLSRMAAKTSPYSTFTGSGEGSWVEDATVFEYDDGWSRRSEAELNVGIVGLICSELVRWPEIKPYLDLRVNSSVAEDHKTLRFLQPNGGEVVSEVAASPTLRHILDVIRNGEDHSRRAVESALLRLDPNLRSADITDVLDKLVRVNLLETSLGIPDQKLGDLGQLCTVLERFPGRRVERMRGLLRQLQKGLVKYTRTVRPAKRYALADGLYAVLKEVYGELGLLERGISLPRKNAFFENTVLEKPRFRCSPRAWQSVLDDLGLLQRLAGLYDRSLPGRLTAGTFFEDHYGAGARVNLLRFYKAYCEEGRHPAGWRPEYRVSGSDLPEAFQNPFFLKRTGLERLKRLDRLQQEIPEWLAAQPVREGARWLDNSMLRDFLEALPPFVDHADSLAFYCQLFVRDGAPNLVLNTFNSGFGRSHNLVRRLESLGNRPQSPMGADAEADQVLYVPVSGVFGSNTNLHGCEPPYEIVYPGTTSTVPPERRIPLSDLQVLHDPHSGNLHLISNSLGRKVKPLHLGTMGDFWLPPVFRFLIQAFGQLPSNFYFAPRMMSLNSCDVVGAVYQTPRLRLGNIFVERATWTTKSHELPTYGKGESELDYVVKMMRWCREHGVPRQFFARVLDFEVPGSSRPILGKARKPVYVDSCSLFSLRVFEQMTREPGQTVTLQEVLPAHDNLPILERGSHYVCEHAVELTRRGGRRV